MFLTAILDFLGAKGIAIIVLLLVIVLEGGIIWAYKGKVKSLNENIATLTANNKILKSNVEVLELKISEADKRNQELQAALDKTEHDNKKIRKETNELKDKLAKMPMAIDAVGAITELKSQASIAAKKWNSK
jgi:septal ring factor EnvC (AmiA/AmiB activator)